MEAPKVSTAHFSISGEFITEHARALWYEAKYKKAFDLLDCCIGISKDQIYDIIEGRSKLIGVNDIELVPDNWVPEDRRYYPTYEEMLDRASKYPDLMQYVLEQCKELAWKYVTSEYDRIQTGETADERVQMKRLISRMVDPVTADELIEEAYEKYDDQEEYKEQLRQKEDERELWLQGKKATVDMVEPPSVADIYRKGLKDGTLDMSDLCTYQNVMLFAPEVLMEHQLNRTKVKAVKDKDFSKKAGWLLPNGDYYSCGWMEHGPLADKIFDDPTLDNPERKAEELGWVKCSGREDIPFLFFEKKPTKKQYDRLFDYCQKWNIDYTQEVESNISC